MTPERVIALARDVLCIGVSLAGVMYQQLTGSYNAALLTAYVTLLTASGVANLRELRRGSESARTRSRSSSSSRRSRSTASSRSSEGGDEG